MLADELQTVEPGSRVSSRDRSSDPSQGDPRDELDRLPGLVHVAALAFVAARTVPGLGFSVAASGGIALSRATERLGLRQGLGASIAAVLEAIAILGPARLGAPLGQTVTAPAIGGIARRGGGRFVQFLACFSIRLVFNLVGTSFFIWVIAGGVKTYAGAYDTVLGRIPGVPEGVTAALVLTVVGIALWSIGASVVQIWAYRRASARWTSDEPTVGAHAAATPESAPERDSSAAPSRRRRPFDPRAVTLAAAASFALLLISTEWALLGAVAAWLTLAWLIAPADREVVPTGITLAALLGVGAFVANLLGGEGVGGGLEHAARAALLVLVATWMRGAAGTAGFKEVARRVLTRVRRVPAIIEATEMLDQLGGERRMGDAARSLAAQVRSAPQEPLALFDAVLAWIAVEAERFQAGSAPVPPRLAYRPLDAALLTIVAVPALAFGLPAG